MPRRRYTHLSAFSLVLCVAACALWIRSSNVCDVYRTQSGGRVTSNLRAVSFGSFYPPSEFGYWCGPATRNDYEYDRSPGIRHDWRFLGFRWRVTDGGAVPGIIYVGIVLVPPRHQADQAVIFRWRKGWSVEIPHWFLAVILAILPFRWLRLRSKGAHRLNGFCHACGYDLRATPHRCPECGTAVMPPLA